MFDENVKSQKLKCFEANRPHDVNTIISSFMDKYMTDLIVVGKYPRVLMLTKFDN